MIPVVQPRTLSVSVGEVSNAQNVFKADAFEARQPSRRCSYPLIRYLSAKEIGMTRKTYEKPSLIKRESLPLVAANGVSGES